MRDGDFVQIVNGNCGPTLNTGTAIGSYNTVSSHLTSLGRKNLTFGIYTSDLDNVQSVATATTNTSGISYIAYGYEPGCGDEFPADVSFPDSTGWVFSNALSSVTTAKNYASNAGKSLMVVPTGRPLLNPDLASYNWDYTQFISSAGASYVLVQTQTWASQRIFKDAVDELNYQISKSSVSKSLIRPQVTVDPDANPNVNGVDATTAFNAVKTAQSRGFYSMSMWYDMGDTASATSYLNQISTLNSSQILGPTFLVDGSSASDNTPTLQFYLSDPNSSDTVKARVQIDDNSDFSSPVVDYTSVLAAQGSVSFTVGQVAGSGSYTTGSESQTLPDGSYYWRVKTIDDDNASSPYSVANGGAVAFQVKTTGARPPGVTLPLLYPNPVMINYDLKTDTQALETSTTTVTLNFNVANVERILVSNYPDFRESQSIPYILQTTWELLPFDPATAEFMDATKRTVYAIFISPFKQASDSVADDIILKKLEEVIKEKEVKQEEKEEPQISEPKPFKHPPNLFEGNLIRGRICG